jgi:F420-non-reducing hydrogenase small subunit
MEIPMKPKLAFYWCASCGGCEVAIIDLHEKLLDLAEKADIVFWPCAMDFKYSDLEGYEDGYIDFSFINGAIRTSEDVEKVELLRQKSKQVVAFGSCSCFGGIPGLANLSNKEEIFERVYGTESTEKRANLPLPRFKVDGEELSLPEYLTETKPLEGVIKVDYFIPGCPPQTSQTAEALDSLLKGESNKRVFASAKSVCEECPRQKEEKRISEIKRIYEIQDDGRCFLEQGVPCLGPATAGGCDARCVKANFPCLGCNGPTQEATDQGARMVAALASALGIEEEEKMEEKKVDELIDEIIDPIGTFYKFSLPKSILKKRWKDLAGEQKPERKS